MIALAKVLAIPAVALGSGIVVLAQTPASSSSSFTMAVVAVVAALATSVVAIGGFVLSARGWIVNAVIESTRVQERIDARAEHKAADAVSPLVAQLQPLAHGIGAVQQSVNAMRDKLHELEMAVVRTGSELAALDRLMSASVGRHPDRPSQD